MPCDGLRQPQCLWCHFFSYLFVARFCRIRLPLTARIEENMYKGQSGMWSWLFHRIAGLGILLFLLIHIVDISLLNFGPAVYNDSIALFSLPIVRIVTLALVGGLFYHTFNGIRIILIDFWPKAARFQSTMFGIALVLTLLCTLGIGWYIVAPIFGIHLGNTSAGI
jgi:succinate dehydrogenase / fumarate reductase, cytochrome b subunit